MPRVIGPVIQELPPLLSVSHHIYTSAGVSQRESGCGSGAWTGYYCSNINTPPKTDPRSNTNNCHIMCYIDRKHLPPLLSRAAEGEQVRGGFHAEALLYVWIMFLHRKQAQVWSQSPSDYTCALLIACQRSRACRDHLFSLIPDPFAPAGHGHMASLKQHHLHPRAARCSLFP